MPRHLGKDAGTIDQVAKDLSNATDASVVDSSLSGVPTGVPSIPAGITGNTSIPTEQYKSMSPDIIPSVDRTEGFSSSAASNPSTFSDVVTPKLKTARGANAIDLANLDESNMMDLPFIEAKSYEIAAMLDVKAKDPGVRFRWVNFKNNEGGNYQMFKAIGFENAVVDDVDETKTPIGENLVRDGNSIKFYDVILMKVNVIRLMQAYKANVVKSLNMVGRWSESAVKEAKRTFNNEVSPDILAAMRQQGLSVDFYIPDKNEFRVRNAKGDLVEAD